MEGSISWLDVCFFKSMGPSLQSMGTITNGDRQAVRTKRRAAAI